MHKKALGIEARKSRYGYVFLTPWILGMLLFFIIPVIQSIWYSFCTVQLEKGGFVTEFVGLEQYNYILKEEPNYTDNLLLSFSSFATSLPIIVAVSLILAVVLNQKFHGRLFFRTLFFAPVIIAGGVVMDFLNGGSLSMESMASTGGSAYTVSSVNFMEILSNLNLPTQMTTLISQYVSSVFNLIWNCGVPIVLFIAGLQTIPPQLYEASTVEGANKWEEFWYITIPMMMNVLVLVVVYTSLDLFTSDNNAVIGQAYSLMKTKVIYDISAAMLWLYFGMVAVVLGAVLYLIYRLAFRKWQ